MSIQCPTKSLKMPELVPEEEVVAWRRRGPRGGWVYDEEKTKWPSEPLVRARPLSAFNAPTGEKEEDRG